MREAMLRYRDPALTVLVGLEVLWLFGLAPLEQVKAVPSVVNDLVTALLVAVVLVICSGNRPAELTVIVATAVDVAAMFLHHVAPSVVTVGIDLGMRVTFLL